MSPQQSRRLEQDDTRIDLAHYVRLIWRRKLFVLLPVVFITSITAVGVRFMSPVYQSHARIHLEPRTRVNSELERRIVDEDRRVRAKDQLLQVRNQITSRGFLESVVRELGLQNDPTILSQAKLIHQTRTPDVPTDEVAMRLLVKGLRGKLDAKNADANMYFITLSDNDPTSAYLLAKVVTRSFVDEVKRGRMDKLEELFKFSTQQQRVYSERLDLAQKELQDFQSKLIREQNVGNPINVANVGMARNEATRLDLDVEQAERRVEALRATVRQVFDPAPDPKVLRSDKEVAAFERRLRAGMDAATFSDIERMRATGDGSVSSSALDPDGASRAALRHRLAALVEERYPSADAFYRDKIAEYVYEVVSLDLERQTVANLKQQVEHYSRQAEAQPEKELQLTALQTKAQEAQINLETFERTLQSAEVSETLMATQLAGGVDIVDPPEKPVVPVKPNRTRLVAVAFLLSLFGGFASVFGLEYLDKSFKTIEEIEKALELHVVGTIPRVATGLAGGGMPGTRKRAWMVASSLAILFVVLGGMVLYEHLLRKQHVTVPQDRAEEILRGDRGAVPAAVRGSTGTGVGAASPDAPGTAVHATTQRH
jgi:uncharacterized protein involved in exopolysaccharide biosynthesis